MTNGVAEEPRQADAADTCSTSACAPPGCHSLVAAQLYIAAESCWLALVCARPASPSLVRHASVSIATQAQANDDDSRCTPIHLL
eukprot:scaffold19702_cov98-Isochrysis_galbana.AAC.2